MKQMQALKVSLNSAIELKDKNRTEKAKNEMIKWIKNSESPRFTIIAAIIKIIFIRTLVEKNLISPTEEQKKTLEALNTEIRSDRNIIQEKVSKVLTKKEGSDSDVDFDPQKFKPIIMDELKMAQSYNDKANKWMNELER